MTSMGEDLVKNPLDVLSDYDFTHLFDHLASCGDVSEAFEILTVPTAGQRNAWFDAKLARNNLSGFVRDIRIAWKLAVDKLGDGSESFAESIVREVQCALMISSINTSLDEFPPELLAAAVTARVWSGQEALAIAVQPMEWALRLRGVVALLPILLESDRSVIDVLFGLLRGRPKGERSRDHVGVNDSREIEDEAPDYTDEYLKAVVFERVADLIPEGDLETAVEIAETVRTPWSQAAAVASVARRLRPEARGPAIEKTFGFVRGIGKPSLRAECLALLSMQLPPAERRAVVDEAWELQVGAFTDHPDEQRFALTLKTGVLRVLGGTTQVDEMTTALRQIAPQFDEVGLAGAIERSRQFRPQYKELALMCLAPRLVAFGRRQEALQTVETEISSDYLRLIALLDIDGDATAEDRPGLANSRLKLAGAIEAPVVRARAKVLVGNVYPEVVTAELADEVLSACEQVADDICYKAVQIRDIVNGLDRIAPEERSQVVTRALKICQSITDCEQDVPMKSLAGYLGLGVIKETIFNSFVSRGSVAFSSLKGIANTVSNDPDFEVADAGDPWDEQLISASVDALREIVRTANEGVDPEELRDYGERLAASNGARRYGDAEASAGMFASEEENERLALAGHSAIFLALRLGPKVALDASKAIAPLRDFYWRSAALIALSDSMTEPEATENIAAAMDAACQTRRNAQMAELFGRIARRLTPNRIPVIHQAWNGQLMRMSRDGRHHVAVFLQSSMVLLRRIGSEDAISRLIDVTDLIETWWRPMDGHAEPGSGLDETQPSLQAEEDEAVKQSSAMILDAPNIAIVLGALSSYFVTHNLYECAEATRGELLQLVRENSANDDVLQSYVQFIASATDAYGKLKDVDRALALYNDWFQHVEATDPRRRLMASTVSFGALYVCCEANSFATAQEILLRLMSLASEHEEEERLQEAVTAAYSHFSRRVRKIQG